MKFVQLTDTLWINPAAIGRVEQHGNSTVIYYLSGRESAIPNTQASRVLRLIEEGSA